MSDEAPIEPRAADTDGRFLRLFVQHEQALRAYARVMVPTWDAVAETYVARYADGDLIRATFEVLYAIGWGPADGQQKPLKPGSAQNRLADALGTDETPLPR